MINKNKNLKKRCEDFINNVMELYDVPGVAIGVTWGEFEYFGAKGCRNYITRSPLHENHVFHCGSVSKLFTSMGIMLLIERGLLNFNDRLVELLPDLELADSRCEEVTLLHMLTHTSGLGDVEDYHWDTPRTDAEALKDYVFSDEVRRTPMLWSPGEGGFRYSNMAYELLGFIISKASGKTYEAFIKDEFLEKAGMEDSTFLTYERTGGSLELDDIDKTNMAMPHTKAPDKTIIMEKHYPYNRQHGPSSTLTSNVKDLSKWARSIMEKRFLSREMYDEILKEYAVVPNNGEKMGLGWFMRSQADCEFIGHEGTDDGFRASFWLCLEPGISMIVLSNMTNAPVKKINKKLFEELIHS